MDKKFGFMRVGAATPKLEISNVKFNVDEIKKNNGWIIKKWGRSYFISGVIFDRIYLCRFILNDHY